MSDRFEQLLKTLNQSELEMTSYELADLCWLLLHSPPLVQPTESKKVVEPTSSNGNVSSSLSKLEKEKKKEPAGQLFPRQQSKDSFVGGGSSLTFRVDNPSEIGSSLSLARALKALLQRLPIQERPSILDEVQTVESFAATDQKILAPVFKPVLEPWLELALVFDRSSSMDIWHQTLVDLKTVLQHYGIFRDVQVWQLALKENNLVLYKGLNKTNSRISHPKELLNPNGRCIILVVSDCVASYWQDGKMFLLLELWSQSSLLAILQMLPEWLWLKTGLGLGAKVTLVSYEPGLTNSRLKIRDVLLWENVFHNKNRLQIPVFTLEPLSVERWSGVVVGRSDTKVAGFVLTPDTKEELDTTAELNLTPEEIVRRFLNNASPLAQELAELLAAVPTIFLPVVRLIRKDMLPEAGQVQIAEVFLGGILRVRSSEIKETDPDLVLYDFINPEVRKILQRSSTRSTTVDVFDRVSKYIAKQLNLELRDFLAELKKPLAEVNEEREGIIRPFAEVAASILRNLGGNYLAIAQELEQAAESFSQIGTENQDAIEAENEEKQSDHRKNMTPENQPNTGELKQFIAKFQHLIKEARQRNPTFLLVGRTGVGKSSTINTLLGEKLAKVGKFRPVTKDITKYSSSIEDIPYTVFDTPGLSDISGKNQEYISSIKLAVPVPDSMWYVTILGEQRVRDDERKTIKTISSAFGPQVWERAVIVFTFADKITPDEYNEYLTERTKLIQEEIANSGVKTDIAQQIPSVAVANDPQTGKSLPTPDGEPWLSKLYITVIKRISDRGLLPIFLATASRLKLQDTNSKEFFSSSEAEPILLNEKQQQEVKEKLERSSDFAGIATFAGGGAIAGMRVGSSFGLPGIVVGGTIGTAISLSIYWWHRRK